MMVLNREAVTMSVLICYGIQLVLLLKTLKYLFLFEKCNAENSMSKDIEAQSRNTLFEQKDTDFLTCVSVSYIRNSSTSHKNFVVFVSFQ